MILTVQLMSVQVFSTRIALPAALVLAFKLFLRVWLYDPSTLLGRFVSLRIEHRLQFFRAPRYVVRSRIRIFRLGFGHGFVY
jgi:hypothetical protein